MKTLFLSDEVSEMSVRPIIRDDNHEHAVVLMVQEQRPQLPPEQYILLSKGQAGLLIEKLREAFGL